MVSNIINKTNLSIEQFIQTPITNKGKGAVEDRMNHLTYVLSKVSNLGSFLEFGVYAGATINLIADMFSNETIWGFDSFEGLPEDWVTTDNKLIMPKGHFSVTNLPEVRNNVRLIKGWFDQSLPMWLENNTNNISFLHIDCDLYSSTKTVLNLLNPYIVRGTIISFDELYHFGNPKKYTKWEQGEFKALKEWVEAFDRSFEIISRNRHMQSSIRVLK